MKKLIFQKFIFILIFILFPIKSIQDICSQDYCTIGTNTYSINANSYTDTIEYRPKYNYGGSISCLSCPGIKKESYYTINESGNCVANICEGDKISEIFVLISCVTTSRLLMNFTSLSVSLTTMSDTWLPSLIFAIPASLYVVV